MRHLKLAALIFIFTSGALAQDVIKKGDAIVHISGMDAFGARNFYIDIYQSGNSANIKYAYLDSVKRSEVRSDPEFRRVSDKRQQYDVGAPERTGPLLDTLGFIFKKHSAYTRDSVEISLKSNPDYKNLLQKFIKATKEELAPKIEHTWADGCTISSVIVTSTRNDEIHTDTPQETTHPLLISFIRNTLDKKKDSEAVNKILKVYVEYK